jgi:DNA-binding MarR family transcriptional regulator
MSTPACQCLEEIVLVGSAGLAIATIAEWVFLRALFSQEDVSPSQLAATLGMTRSAISKLSDRLLAKKLLIRSADDQDDRAHTLTLTRKGRERVPVLAAWPMPTISRRTRPLF